MRCNHNVPWWSVRTNSETVLATCKSLVLSNHDYGFKNSGMVNMRYIQTDLNPDLVGTIFFITDLNELLSIRWCQIRLAVIVYACR